jgi:hypothetical protein
MYDDVYLSVLASASFDKLPDTQIGVSPDILNIVTNL